MFYIVDRENLARSFMKDWLDAFYKDIQTKAEILPPHTLKRLFEKFRKPTVKLEMKHFLLLCLPDSPQLSQMYPDFLLGEIKVKLKLKQGVTSQTLHKHFPPVILLPHFLVKKLM